jgi:ATP-dependent Clp protease adapter protein ClpS
MRCVWSVLQELLSKDVEIAAAGKCSVEVHGSAIGCVIRRDVLVTWGSALVGFEKTSGSEYYLEIIKAFFSARMQQASTI